ncbi:TPA: hypothetical protein HA235_00500 [Candidatus Woesearchaeota archaeon]|nr:hypothetical protein [Candidatus Woesearchaeota archaeon]HIH31164.1 hypothetical protein [Candidatus Woesearchaeota archaeon]HIH54645.1 hypothetical protein [Candidatus Woesearchaeota archaeon]HIJ02302.1 hypothetical protein [Candidatus Woesearchaeota archaeon]HIJ14221.1 hypothetical protein [Candidatus Woesearchaeota archaeon]
MSNILDWIENKEHLKIAIIDYVECDLDIINLSEEYWIKHWEIFKRKKDNKRISPREFSERLYNYLWIPKVSELIIILYLEDLKDITPTIYEINKLLRRTTNQYSVTFKSVKKLEDLDIIFTKTIKGSNRKQKQIYIKKDVVKIYGDDEFRQMMLNEWDIDAKVYIKRKLNWLLKEKEKVENRIKMIKKSRRYMGDKNDE